METSKLDEEIEKIKPTPLEEFKIKQTNELIEKIEKLRLSLHG